MKHFNKLTLILILLSGLLLRVLELSSDPPRTLSRSDGIYTDEGLRAHNARNKVLFNEWIIDEYNEPYYVYPIYTVSLYSFFKIFGISLFTLRLHSIMYVIISIILIVFTVHKSKYDYLTILLFLIFISYSALLIMCNRIGFLENQLLFFISVMMFMYSYASKDVKYWMPIGGTAVISFFVKPTVVFILPILLLLVIIDSFDINNNRLPSLKKFSAIWFMTGFIFCATLFIFYWVKPHYDNIRYFFMSMVNYTPRIHTNPHVFFKNIIDENNLSHTFFRTPCLFCISFCYLITNFKEIINRKLPRIEYFLVLWFFIGLIFYLIQPYKPTRYFFLLIVPMCLLSAIGLDRFYRTVTRNKYMDKIYVSGLIFILSFTLILSIRSQINIGNSPGISIKSIIFLSIITMLLGSVFVFRFFIYLTIKYRITIISLYIVSFLFVNVSFYREWMSNLTYKIYNTSHQLCSDIPHNSVIASATFGDELSLYNKHKFPLGWLPLFGKFESQQKWTHILLNLNEKDLFLKYLPNLFDQTIIIREYDTPLGTYTLYKIEN